jgi:hypothetical protein
MGPSPEASKSEVRAICRADLPIACRGKRTAQEEAAGQRRLNRGHGISGIGIGNGNGNGNGSHSGQTRRESASGSAFGRASATVGDQHNSLVNHDLLCRMPHGDRLWLHMPPGHLPVDYYARRLDETGTASGRVRVRPRIKGETGARGYFGTWANRAPVTGYISCPPRPPVSGHSDNDRIRHAHLLPLRARRTDRQRHGLGLGPGELLCLAIHPNPNPPLRKGREDRRRRRTAQRQRAQPHARIQRLAMCAENQSILCQTVERVRPWVAFEISPSNIRQGWRMHGRG